MRKIFNPLIIESSNKEALDRASVSIAKYNLCLEDGKIDCKCRSCRIFESGQHPDLIRIVRESGKKEIPVAIVRSSILSRTKSKPITSGIILLQIMEGDKLSTQAQNSLLKTLEEPPSYLRVLIATPTRKKLLETILSRSEIFMIKSEEDLVRLEFPNILKIAEMSIPKRLIFTEELLIADSKKDDKNRELYYIIYGIINELRELGRHIQVAQGIGEQIAKDLHLALKAKRNLELNGNAKIVMDNFFLNAIEHELYSGILSKIAR